MFWRVGYRLARLTLTKFKIAGTRAFVVAAFGSFRPIVQRTNRLVKRMIARVLETEICGLA